MSKHRKFVWLLAAIAIAALALGAEAVQMGTVFLTCEESGATRLHREALLGRNVQTALTKGFTGREIRCLLLKAHYRETFNFTLEGLADARTSLARLDECLAKLRELAGNATAPADAGLSERFSTALDNDLNVSAAWRVVFDWVRETNRLLVEDKLAPARAAATLAAWQRIDSVFGIGEKGEAEAPAEIVALLERRQAARGARDFKSADALRDELKAKGWVIEDTPRGSRLKQL